MMKNLLTRPDLKAAFIDLEASSLHPSSYPIEVGVALIGPTGTPIRTWSSLIRPTDDWLQHGHWSEASGGVHGIKLEELLEQGSSVHDVTRMLNGLLAAQQAVVSDAPMHDASWLDRLFRAADEEQLFTLRGVEALTRDLSHDQHRQLGHLLNRDAPPHRAGPDALRLASRLMEAHLGYAPPSLPY